MGFLVAGICQKRYTYLKEIKRILGLLYGEISFRHSTLKEAFSNIAKRCLSPFSLWLESMADELNETEGLAKNTWESSVSILTKDGILGQNDIEELKKLGDTLGCVDIDTQLLQLENCERQYSYMINDTADSLKNVIKTARCLGLLIGILVVLIFI